MLKNLRLDFYKLFHSKVLLGLLIFSAVFVFVSPCITYLIHKDASLTVLGALMQEDGGFFILWMFAVPFLAKDISSGYMKNVLPNFSAADKLKYVLSKIFYIFLYTLCYTLLIFLVWTAFTYIFGAKTMYNPEIDNVSRYPHLYADRFTLGGFFLI